MKLVVVIQMNLKDIRDNIIRVSGKDMEKL